MTIQELKDFTLNLKKKKNHDSDDEKDNDENS